MQNNEMNAQAIGSGSKESEIWAWRFYQSRIDKGFKACTPVKLFGRWTVNWQFTDTQLTLPFVDEIDPYNPIDQ
jgi:hypothetical protein